MSRHDVDLLALFSGIVFVALGVAYVVAPAVGLQVRAVWALPGLLVALGAAGLIGTTGRARRRDD